MNVIIYSDTFDYRESHRSKQSSISAHGEITVGTDALDQHFTHSHGLKLQPNYKTHTNSFISILDHVLCLNTDEDSFRSGR